jgi:hypothetical protein
VLDDEEIELAAADEVEVCCERVKHLTIELLSAELDESARCL